MSITTTKSSVGTRCVNVLYEALSLDLNITRALQAYVRCKIDNLEIPIPAKDSEPASKVVLQKGEHLAIEVSYKYTQAEARAMFHAAGFRLVQQWSDQRRLHSIYLLEQPAVMFKSNSPALEAIGMDVPENPYGVPSLAEWKQMWKTWDMLTVRARGTARPALSD